MSSQNQTATKLEIMIEQSKSLLAALVEQKAKIEQHYAKKGIVLAELEQKYGSLVTPELEHMVHNFMRQEQELIKEEIKMINIKSTLPNLIM